MKFLDLVQGSPEWLAVRKKYATASDMPCIMGIPGAFKSRKRLLREKLEGAPPPTEFEQALFDRGHAVEIELREYAEKYLCLKLPPCVILDKRRGILASIDGFCKDSGVVVEMKNSTSEKKISVARDGGVWQPYKVQLMTQMLVAKADIGFLVMQDDRSGERFVSSVEADKKMYREINKAAKQFVTEIRTKAPYFESSKTMNPEGQ